MTCPRLDGSVIAAADRTLRSPDPLFELEDVLRAGEIRFAVAHLLLPEPAIEALEQTRRSRARGAGRSELCPVAIALQARSRIALRRSNEAADRPRVSSEVC